MTIEQAVRAYLIADLTLYALIGERLYPEQGEQAAEPPFGVYSEARTRTFRALASVVNLNALDLHLDFYALDHATVKAARNAARARLNTFQGNIGGATYRLQGAFDESGDGGAELPLYADELGLFRAGLDVSIYWATN